MKVYFCLLLFYCFGVFYAQQKRQESRLGFHYGLGNEFKNSNYTYTNRYYKLQLHYKIKETKYFMYELLIQPEIDISTHQLLNFYFVQPDEPNYIEKREQYTKLKDIKAYALGIAFCVRKPISKTVNIYALASVGPVIIDTETERLSKGFAFSDVIAIGFSLKLNKITFDLEPNLRHVSNAGLQNTNSGYNTKNIEFGFSIPF